MAKKQSSWIDRDIPVAQDFCHLIKPLPSNVQTGGGTVGVVPRMSSRQPRWLRIDRMLARLPELNDAYTVTMWFWNGMPNDAREVAGWMFSRGHDNGLSADSEHLGLGGTATQPGRLVFARGDGASPLVGSTEIARWTWNHVTLVRNGPNVRVYLNGNPKAELEAVVSSDARLTSDRCFFGGRCDNDSNWEGRLDEVAVFDRILSPSEIRSLSSRD